MLSLLLTNLRGERRIRLTGRFQVEFEINEDSSYKISDAQVQGVNASTTRTTAVETTRLVSAGDLLLDNAALEKYVFYSKYRHFFFFKEDPDPPVDVGGDYFNRYQGYKLGGKISGENFSSLSDAKNRCSALKSSCSGVVNDYAGHYYLSTSYTFSSASGHTTYEKGEKGRVKICFSIQ